MPKKLNIASLEANPRHHLPPPFDEPCVLP